MNPAQNFTERLVRPILISFFHVRVSQRSDFLLSVFSIKISRTFLVSNPCYISRHLIRTGPLYYSNNKAQTCNSSSFSFLHPSVSSSIGPNIVLTALFSNILNPYFGGDTEVHISKKKQLRGCCVLRIYKQKCIHCF